MLKRAKQNLNPLITNHLAFKQDPFVVQKASMQHIYDQHGKKYLDVFAQHV